VIDTLTVITKRDNLAHVYDTNQLRSFLAVAQARSFTRAAHGLGLGQSTVSQHVRKLEEAVGRVLLRRDTHLVALTVDGETLVGFARDILDAHERARRHFDTAQVRGRLRLGVSDDLVATRLPQVLREFRLSHPMVDLAVTVDLSSPLYERLDAADLDLVFAKRPDGESRGRTVWRDRVVWLAAPDLRLAADEPVPLVAYPPPSISRGRALTALNGQGRAWRLTCVSASLAGLVAAARSGLGVLPHARKLAPPGLVPAPASAGLPPLGDVEFILLDRRGPVDEPAAALARAIEAAIPLREPA